MQASPSIDWKNDTHCCSLVSVGTHWLEKQARLSRTKSMARKKTIEYVKKSGAIEASKEEMLAFAKKAKDALRLLEPSDALNSLVLLADYSMEREL